MTNVCVERVVVGKFVLIVFLVVTEALYSQTLYMDNVDLNHLTEAATFFCNQNDYFLKNNISCKTAKVYQTTADGRQRLLTLKYDLVLNEKMDRTVSGFYPQGVIQEVKGVFSKKADWYCKFSFRNLMFYAQMDADGKYQPKHEFYKVLKSCVDHATGPHRAFAAN